MTEKNPLISIISPVFQVKDYLPACVESVLAQTLPDWELILVDDGATDGSGELCDAYAAQDGRITVIHQKNQGVSAARNLGLSRVRGAYVIFLDSDDRLKPDCLEVLYRDIREQGADIACCDAVSSDPETELIKIDLIKAPRLLRERETLMDDIAANEEFYWSCIWGKLYKAELLRGARFEAMRYGEDIVFLFDLFNRSPVVYLDTYEGYYYISRGTSAMAAGRDLNEARQKSELEMEYHIWTNLPPVGQKSRGRLLNRLARRTHSLAYTAAALGTKAHDGLLHDALTEVLGSKDLLSSQMKLYIYLYAYLPPVYRAMARIKSKKLGNNR